MLVVTLGSSLDAWMAGWKVGAAVGKRVEMMAFVSVAKMVASSVDLLVVKAAWMADLLNH